jgi:hypothetical protein
MISCIYILAKVNAHIGTGLQCQHLTELWKLWGNWKKLHYIESGTFSKQQKALKPPVLEEFVSALAAWLQKAHAYNVSHDGTNIKEKTLPIITLSEIDRSTIFSGWINRFKRRHNTDIRTLAGESWSVDSESRRLEKWLTVIVRGYKEYDLCDVHNNE